MDISVTATGTTCPHCQNVIQNAAEMVSCGLCGVKHHLACWQYRQNCSTPGCAGSPVQNQATQAAYPATTIIPPTPIINPSLYVTPMQPPQQGDVYFEGNNIVIIRDGGTLPPVCIATGRMNNLIAKHRKEYWSPPWVYLLILISPLIAVIVSIIIRKYAQINYCIDREEAGKTTKFIILNYCLAVAMFVGAIFCLPNDSTVGIGLFLLFSCLVAPIVIYLTLIKKYTVQKIENGYAWIKFKNPRVYQAIYSACNNGQQVR